MNRKKILFLITSMERGGAERVVSLLINYLSKNYSHKIFLILMEPGISYDLPTDIEVLILSKRKKSYIWKLMELPFVALKLLYYAKKEKIDTIFSFIYRANYVNCLMKLFNTSYRSIISIRSTTSLYKDKGILGKINLFLISKLYGKADLIVSNSEGVKNDLERLFHFHNKHIVINNPIDLDYIMHETEDDIDYLLNPERKYIISVGRLEKAKKHKDLILAFNEIKKKIPEYDVLILGEGKLNPKLNELIKNLDLQKRIFLVGEVSNPFGYMVQSKLFVLTSEYEGFPNVLLEALACKLPVISTDCNSGPREILSPASDRVTTLKDSIEYAEFGILVPVNNTGILAEAILALLADENLARRYSNKSFNRAKEHSIEKIAIKYEEIFFG